MKKKLLFTFSIFFIVFVSLVSSFALRDYFSSDVKSSFDHVKEEQINVFGDRVLIELDGKELKWSKFTDTNSMNPLFGKGHNGLEIVPESTDDVHVGDIISFNYNNELYVHRVVEIGYDDKGWCALTKGDNNDDVDPGKRRFEDVNGVYFGVIF